MIPKKSLGQHFLRCEWVISTLINTAKIIPEDTILEIGTGEGTLTKALAKTATHVIAVEKDETLAENLLKEIKKEDIQNISVISGDILKLFPYIKDNMEAKPPYAGLASILSSTHFKVVSNIPYYLTSRLFRVLLSGETRPEAIILTIQKEVAERIVAKSPHMNMLALSIQAFGTPRIIKEVPASCFWPKPKVDSSIIEISDISDNFFVKNNVSEKNFFKLTRLAFNQKRKLLLNSLSTLVDKKELADTLTKIGLSPKSRPEELSLGEWAELIRSLSSPILDRSRGQA